MPNITVYLSDEEYVKYLKNKSKYSEMFKEYITQMLGEKNEHKC
jgi:hypothetical protein